MYLKELIEWLEHESALVKWLMFVLIIALATASTTIVLATGGTRAVYVHTMYIPVVMASLVFGVRGGVATGILGGLLLGPYVPVETETSQMQGQSTWIIRMAFFLLVGALVGTFSDLVRYYLKQIRWKLFNDESTKLPNKYSLLDYLAKIKTHGNDSSVSWLYLFDVTNLEDHVLRLGPKVESLALIKLSNRLQEKLDESARSFHIHNNKIALLGGELEEIKPLITEALSHPVTYEGIPLLLNYTWSSVALDDDVNDIEEYLRRVEVSLMEARKRKRSHFSYTPGLEQHARQNVELLGLFKNALDNNGLSLHYQPKYRLSDRDTIAVEALIRWTDPLRGFISPGDFIPLVEDSFLIDPLTLWVIDRALSDLVILRNKGIILHSVAVNISTVNLMADNFTESITSILDKHQVDASSLELELTENAVMSDINQAVSILNEISNSNIAISIDDFGTGFSSLQYLDRLPINSVKIDQMFIKNMLTDPSKNHIVETTIELARRLNLNTIAEGVETQDMEDQLVRYGCEIGQGFHYCKPLSLPDLENFLSA